MSPTRLPPAILTIYSMASGSSIVLVQAEHTWIHGELLPQGSLSRGDLAEEVKGGREARSGRPSISFCLGL